MMRLFPVALGFLLLVGGCRSAALQSEAAAPDRAPAPMAATHIPIGLEFDTRLEQALSTSDSRVGDTFVARVTQPVLARNGETLIPAGAAVHGRVTALDHSDRIGDVAYIRVAFDRIAWDGRNYSFGANVTDTDIRLAADGEVRRTVERAGIGAAAGAALGAILGGDFRDAVTGAVIGAGVGTAISLGTGEVEAALPAGTQMTLRATQRVELR